jgi:hypothetical protein
MPKKYDKSDFEFMKNLDTRDYQMNKARNDPIRYHYVDSRVLTYQCNFRLLEAYRCTNCGTWEHDEFVGFPYQLDWDKCYEKIICVVCLLQRKIASIKKRQIEMEKYREDYKVR